MALWGTFSPYEQQTRKTVENTTEVVEYEINAVRILTWMASIRGKLIKKQSLCKKYRMQEYRHVRVA